MIKHIENLIKAGKINIATYVNNKEQILLNISTINKAQFKVKGAVAIYLYDVLLKQSSAL